MPRLILPVLFVFIVGLPVQQVAADSSECGSRWTQQEDGSLMDSGDFVSCWYVDLGAGYSHVEPDGEGNGWSVDRDESIAWHVRGGWHFRPRIFAELNYVNLGESELVNSNAFVDQAFPDAAIAFQASSLMAGFKFLNPDSLWNVYAKLGAAYIISEEQDDGGTVFYEENDDIQLAGGIGVQYRFENTPWRVRFDADAYAKDLWYLGFSISRYFGGSSRKITPTLPSTRPTIEESYEPEPVVTPRPSEPVEFQRPRQDEARVINCSTGFTGAVPSVNFDAGSANLRPEASDILNTFANDLIAAPGATVEIQAHTDTQEDSGFTQDLAQRRADSVRNFLMQMGVPAERLTARGFGERYPIGDNASDEGREMNRRVVFDVLDRALCK